MFLGRYASRSSEARYPQLWNCSLFRYCPSIQGPAGLNLYDLSGRSYHGTLTNMDPATDWVLSGGRYALDFDGTNDAVAHPQFSMTGAFTFSLWFNKRTNGTFGERIVWGLTSDNDVYVADIAASYIWTQSVTTLQAKQFLFTIANSTWYHLAVTRDAANNVRMFLNGIESVSGSKSVTGAYTLNRIGQYADNAAGNVGYMWDGFLDDLCVYSRPLSVGEIRLLARRRGIAYEPRIDVFGQSSGRRRRFLIGAAG